MIPPMSVRMSENGFVNPGRVTYDAHSALGHNLSQLPTDMIKEIEQYIPVPLYFSRQPRSTWRIIFSQLNDEDIFAVARSCRFFAAYFKEPHLVKDIFERLNVIVLQDKGLEYESEEHKKYVQNFFKLASLLPENIKFVSPDKYDSRNRLSELLNGFSPSKHLKNKLHQITSNTGKEKYLAKEFATRLPARFLSWNEIGCAEFNRRFINKKLSDDDFNAYVSYQLLFWLCLEHNRPTFLARSASPQLLKKIIHIKPPAQPINYFGFYMTFNFVKELIAASLTMKELKDRVMVLGDWFAKNMRDSEKAVKAHNTIHLLYLAAAIHPNYPMDQQVRTWMPLEYVRNWQKLADELEYNINDFLWIKELFYL